MPLFQSGSKCETILMKMTLICMKMTLICMKMKLHAELIYISKVSYLDLFSYRGKGISEIALLRSDPQMN